MPDFTSDLKPLADVIREYVLAVCDLSGWNLDRAAAVLGICKKTLYNHLHRYAKQGHTSHEPRGSSGRVRWGRKGA